MRQTLLVGILLLPTFSAQAYVDDDTEVDPVVVTATRTAETAEETLASVTVVTREDIERRQARSVPDALRGIPGLAITNNGGAGKTTSFFLRGTESDHVLVLIDGVKVGSATLGTTAFQNLPIGAVERIEVVRGPRSSLYGSEAIGGVIQIFTRKGGGDLRPRFTVGAGTHGTTNVSGGLSAGGERGWIDVGASYEDTNGFNSCDGQVSPGAGCYVDQPDDDGFRSKSTSARMGYRFTDWIEADLHWLRSDGEVEYDGSATAGDESKDRQQVLGGRIRLTPTGAWTSTITAGRAWDESRVYYDGSFLSAIETERDSLSWQNDIALGISHLVTLGVDYQRDQVDGTLAYDEDERDNTGVFGQYLGGFGAHDVQLSLRYDDNEQFGDYTTGTAAWGYSFANGLRLTASYGTAFKAPSFNELYYPGYGNPGLDPEESQSVELGVAGRLAAARWSLNLYQTDIDDLIAYDATLWGPNNIDSARIRGLEAVVATEVRDWAIEANLTLLDPENRSDGANDGNRLARRPEQTFELDLDRSFGPIGVGGTLFVAGRSFDDAANAVRLDGYTLVDLRAEYAFSPTLRVQGRVENLFDEDYETADWYNQPGRVFYLTLRYEL
ncbi:TonB-dependent vitamin B12 receptor [Thioflavicoccus mobilis 8321]|uniref:TonB-dependent vitamin B12 receptor n=1 Tax=Thioflavicoccus mobilis 8321 TaxID=765912 RepID=L0GY50_9GAMM|nr:TonB-dependent vitamin B12 receptor [Thioflavicoccus mobilis]AGA90234.1 TonB-dependent vitamin B12 receptor [Thioflavicoccus mobilis 8321]